MNQHMRNSGESSMPALLRHDKSYDSFTQVAVDDFLLRELAVQRWIEECLGVQRPHTQPVLASLLSNGVVLCELMSSLDQGSIPRIHTGKILELGFKRRENIMFFIEALRDNKVPPGFIFHVDDLYQEQNMYRVLESLEYLSELAYKEWGAPHRRRRKEDIRKLVDQGDLELTDEARQRAEKVLKEYLVKKKWFLTPKPGGAVAASTVAAAAAAKDDIGTGAAVTATAGVADAGSGPAPATKNLDYEEEEEGTGHKNESDHESESDNDSDEDDGKSDDTRISVDEGEPAQPAAAFASADTTPTGGDHNGSEQHSGTDAVASPSESGDGADVVVSTDGEASGASPAGREQAGNDNDDEEERKRREKRRQRRKKEHRSRDKDREGRRRRRGASERQSRTAAPTAAATAEEDEEARQARREAAVLRGAIRLQAAYRGRVARLSFRAKLRAAAYREKVAHEIFQTERDYVANLGLLFDVFLHPIKEHMTGVVWHSSLSGLSNSSAAKAPPTPLHKSGEAPVTIPSPGSGGSGTGKVELKEFKDLYANAQVIRNFNTKLLDDLKPRIAAWTPHQRLGDIFVQVAMFLKVYTAYVKSYDTVRRELAQARTSSPEFKQYLTECAEASRERVMMTAGSEAGSGGGGAKQQQQAWDINSLLIQPVQRIPRYLLLLRELAKHTPPDHLDYANINTALEQIKKVAEYIEQKSADSEKVHKLISIQSRFQGECESLIDPGRVFVREGHMVGWTLKNKRKQFYTIFLFSDLLVLARPVKGNKNWRKTISMSASKAKGAAAAEREMNDAPPGSPGAQDRLIFCRSFQLRHLLPIVLPETKRGFCFGLAAEFDQTVAKFYAQDVAERDDWLASLREVKKAIIKNTKARDDVIKRTLKGSAKAASRKNKSVKGLSSMAKAYDADLPHSAREQSTHGLDHHQNAVYGSQMILSPRGDSKAATSLSSRREKTLSVILPSGITDPRRDSACPSSSSSSSPSPSLSSEPMGGLPTFSSAQELSTSSSASFSPNSSTAQLLPRSSSASWTHVAKPSSSSSSSSSSSASTPSSPSLASTAATVTPPRRLASTEVMLDPPMERRSSAGIATGRDSVTRSDGVATPPGSRIRRKPVATAQQPQTQSMSSLPAVFEERESEEWEEGHGPGHDSATESHREDDMFGDEDGHHHHHHHQQRGSQDEGHNHHHRRKRKDEQDDGEEDASDDGNNQQHHEEDDDNDDDDVQHQRQRIRAATAAASSPAKAESARSKRISMRDSSSSKDKPAKSSADDKRGRGDKAGDGTVLVVVGDEDEAKTSLASTASSGRTRGHARSRSANFRVRLQLSPRKALEAISPSSGKNKASKAKDSSTLAVPSSSLRGAD